MKSTKLPLDSQLCFSLYAATMAVNRAYKPMLDALGLTYPQYLVLSSLWERDGLAVSGIADRLALEPSTITPLVKRLESAGFLTRERNPRDERQVIVRLTEKSRPLYEKTACLTDTLLERSGLTPGKLMERRYELPGSITGGRVEPIQRRIPLKPRLPRHCPPGRFSPMTTKVIW